MTYTAKSILWIAGGLAPPSLGIVAPGGSLFSVVVRIRFVIVHRALVPDGYPTPP